MLSKKAYSLVGTEVWRYTADNRDKSVEVSFQLIKVAGVLVVDGREFFVNADDYSDTFEVALAFNSYKAAVKNAADFISTF